MATEFTIRLLDEGGIQVAPEELAKLQDWQTRTGSQLMIAMMDEDYCESTNELFRQESLFVENQNPFDNFPPGSIASGNN